MNDRVPSGFLFDATPEARGPWRQICAGAFGFMPRGNASSQDKISVVFSLTLLSLDTGEHGVGLGKRD
jgi:hypothetical protein